MRIDGTGRSSPAAGPRARRAATNFSVPEPQEPAAPAQAEAPAATPPVALAGLIAPPPDPAADAQAASHAGAMLDALAGMQRALLEGSGTGARAALAQLAGNLPSAADPALGQVLQAVAVRAAVELARSK